MPENTEQKDQEKNNEEIAVQCEILCAKTEKKKIAVSAPDWNAQ